MQRLNSTSDTQLNLYGAAAAASATLPGSQDWSSQGLTDPFDEWTNSPPPPLPPVQPSQHMHQQQHSWASRTSSLPAHQHLSSSPVQAFNENGPNSKSEARYKLFYHLAAIFPEEQVRQVMSLMPDETNAQKICAAILALYPKDN
jgi:ribonuclease ZC3H12